MPRRRHRRARAATSTDGCGSWRGASGRRAPPASLRRRCSPPGTAIRSAPTWLPNRDPGTVTGTDTTTRSPGPVAGEVGPPERPCPCPQQRVVDGRPAGTRPRAHGSSIHRDRDGGDATRDRPQQRAAARAARERMRVAGPCRAGATREGRPRGVDGESERASRSRPSRLGPLPSTWWLVHTSADRASSPTSRTVSRHAGRSAGSGRARSSTATVTGSAPGSVRWTTCRVRSTAPTSHVGARNGPCGRCTRAVRRGWLSSSALQATTHLGDVRRRSAEHQQHRDVPRVGPDVRRKLRPVEDRQPIDHSGSLDVPARPGQSRRSRRPPLHRRRVLGRTCSAAAGRPTVRW